MSLRAAFVLASLIATGAQAQSFPLKPLRLNAAINNGMYRTEVRERLVAQGAEPLTGTPEELGELIKRELLRTARIVRDAGLKAQ